jgi:hypothetical protein
MTTEGTWIGYSGAARIGLAVVLLALAGGVAYVGLQWPGPFQARRPRPAVAYLMIAIWVLAIATFLVCLSLYVHQARQDFPGRTAPTDPIAPVTGFGVSLVFIIILTNSRGGPVARLGSAIIGALAAPMIFELPFDLIVMTRTYPQRSDGDLVVGRGVPGAWLSGGSPIQLANMPTTDGHHLGLTIQGHGSSVTLTLTGQQPAGPVLFQLPAFVNNIVSASAGTVDQQTGTVTLSPTVRSVTVQLKRPAG